ncbi:metallophosphoesterase family protein [Thetidibacter halocola]|uniref:Metallophosphoesterase n=1 Tax=Thetidibacter halocola TaxID=2827239 RepID=A0A8J7WCR1_9RHOB|nr:metallophosphoesterase [Thetidibacter halocola]MBS0124034.1 metallophosphoesterase [Thetidibacter halocola]
MSFRFIHASDLHLGRRFANIPQPEDSNIRGRLMEARHGAIGKLAQAARDAGAAHVLLAGDTFDTATPSAPVIRQALAAMAEAAGVTWWLLPGNHDNLRDAEPLWQTITQDGPANVRAIRDADPQPLAEVATLLPCPVAWRATGSDPTEALVTMPSPEGALRIGLAHGGITDFTESGELIAPDRDRSARLDYLALGDWHGRMAVSDRVHYSGSPEQDRFRHGRRGVCLSVAIDGPGAPPRVTEVETGQFLWAEADVPLHPGQDAGAALSAVLPATGRRDVLLRIAATGWATLSDRLDLLRAAGRAGAEFAHFDLVTDALRLQSDEADLEQIDRAGALRMAAEALRDEAASETLGATDRRIAQDALARLHAYVSEGTA